MNYTALILGGGPAGAAAATVLARAGIDLLLVDAGTEALFRVGESLVPSAKALLKELGLWDAFIADGHIPCYGNYSAWGSSTISETDFIRSPYGHGWHLDRARFDATLRRTAAEAGAVLMQGARLLRFEREGDGWRVMMKRDGEIEELTCKWLLDCTGRSRRIATALGVERQFADRLIAFHARFRQEEGSAADRESRTLVESVPQGWLHTALLPGAERIVTLFTDPDTSLRRDARDREGFLEAIAESLHVARLLKEHRYAIIEEPHATDARSSRLDRFHGDGWLAAGDAATAFDPLSSQGIISALYSGLKAGTALVAHLAGDAGALDRYDMQISAVYERFLEERRKYYAMERRWPESGFWSVRGAGGVVLQSEMI